MHLDRAINDLIGKLAELPLHALMVTRLIP
jgi:hypothetical protein